jgi:hypothetical protein
VHSFVAMGLQEAPNRLALQLDAEISCVITAMRQNAKWAVVPGKYNVRHTEGPLQRKPPPIQRVADVVRPHTSIQFRSDVLGWCEWCWAA